jgi:hypothetical protein
VAFDSWPTPRFPVFGGYGAQVPNGDSGKLAYALEDMHQKALSGELRVWGKTPLTVSGASLNSLFDEVPSSHWRDHRVEYMDLVRFDDPSDVMSSRDMVKLNDSWCALMVNRDQVLDLWPPKELDWLSLGEQDKKDSFELYEAACLFFDYKPALPMPSMAQYLYDERR